MIKLTRNIVCNRHEINSCKMLECSPYFSIGIMIICYLVSDLFLNYWWFIYLFIFSFFFFISFLFIIFNMPTSVQEPSERMDSPYTWDQYIALVPLVLSNNQLTHLLLIVLASSSIFPAWMLKQTQAHTRMHATTSTCLFISPVYQIINKRKKKKILM